MCYVLDISTSGYYDWLERPISQREQSNNQLDNKIQNIYSAHNGNYGYPRVHKELENSGNNYSQNRVYRRMILLNLRARTKKNFRVTTDSKHKLPIKNNILNRNFSTNNINEKWVGDITYIHTQEGWLFLATIIDLYSRAIIGWAMDKNMTKDLVCNALNMALCKRKYPSNVIVHTDRGSQYCSNDYQNIIKKYGLIPSMSRKGNCWDNSVAESFFKTIKSELIYNERFITRERAKNQVFNYIECYYNRVRLHSSIGYKTPFEVESNLQQTA